MNTTADAARRLIVTTSARPRPELLAQAEAWAERLDAPCVPRRGGLAKLALAHEVDGILVITPERPIYREPASGLEYFFHPGMAKTRLHNCRRGNMDPMLQAMRLQPGDRVLDCTLGRATDAVVAAWQAGPEGRVVGLEKSRVLAELTVDGLAHYVDPSRELTSLLRRIEARWADHNTTLPDLPDAAYEVVYFDPIFDQPLERSHAMSPLRELADASPLSPAAVAEARRVAARAVVIKQRRGTALWSQLAVDEVISGGGSSRVEYGVVAAR
ncbi:MAG: class I SAM-dependent methyltransferase [Armatimonadetes bacterium]|nr:class I SAM-dependent methyltransferase [Armatimonadota bacterium]